ncbi:RagB/SusD family nutrient uptake outer membrane protein [Flavobacterium sp. ARAG 55.4]|uniref:RagB/SusD family nutrient uptake outer membrane protein n=1 Tax=Flavobacterium sp. ARAG 55.4 TaxID=3451357 RepID=UPI003F467F41
MKRNFKLFLSVIIISLIASSCEDYLDVPPEAAITEDKVFSTYLSFQGFEDQMYEYIVDPNLSNITVGHNLTGETIAKQGWNTSQGASTGNYLNLTQGRSNFRFFDDGSGIEKGIWAYSWKGIRRANISLEKLSLLTNATQQEKDVIEGQAYFFRAYFHFEILRAYGSIPYVNTVLEADGQLQLPRFYEHNGKFDYQACTEFLVEDLQKAAQLLPPSWNNTNTGRVTKGAAYALMAKALLYAGSPLMNENSRNSATYDTAYMNRAAEAAAEVLKLADNGVYGLVPFVNYLDMFAKTDGNLPFNQETIFQKTRRDVGSGEINTFIGRLYLPNNGLFGGNAICEAVTQNFVDIFEMADGTKYKPGTLAEGGYDYDNTKRWNNRDPRFRKSIYVDGDMAGIHSTTKLAMYDGGSTMADGNTLSPYIVHKFWPVGANKKDTQWNTLRIVTPLIRLADVYLIYAEAVYNTANNENATSSNYTMTALQAVNKVRARAGAALVSNLSVYNNNFNALIKYERDVELCFEGHRWYDLRRWKIKPDATLYRMSFNQNYTLFNRVVIQPFVFTDRNYWLPFPINLTYAYEGFPQNPGW